MTKNPWTRAALAWALLSVLVTGCDGGALPDDAGAGDAAGPFACGQGLALCDDRCVDTNVDRAHCGGCDIACAPGEACTGGECQGVCPPSQAACEGACVDFDSDRLHCGACGEACGPGEACVSGACELSCPPGQTVCGAVCVDLQSDPAHCGACDEACAVGVCSAGECAGTCAAGTSDCDGACVDTRTHPDHCGACGQDCGSVEGGVGICVDGECQLVCQPLYDDCNADRASAEGDGCETAIGTDVENCGICGRACSAPAAVMGCDAGACVIAGCEDGFDDCDGSVANGCETDLTADPLSCGACGTVCPSGQGCFSGVCAPIAGESCDDPWELGVGTQQVYWTASTNDYLRDIPSCGSIYSADGPDVVMAYTASAGIHETVTISVAKPSSTRWHLVVSSAACGNATEEAACDSASTGTSLSATFFVPSGETAYIYIADTTSGAAPLSNPLEVTVTTDPVACVPGLGGILGTTGTRVPTGLTSTPIEYYVAADDDPAGYVYVGGTSDLYRIPKAGGESLDVVEAAGFPSTLLGYAMLVDGDNIYIVDTVADTVDRRLYRISTDGGATWNVEDYAFFHVPPEDEFRGITAHDGRIYLVTDEITADVPTQIWSLSGTQALPPAVARLELSLPTLHDCNAIVRDDLFYYLTCDDAGDEILRIAVTGGMPEIVTRDIDLNTTVNALHGHDIDGDGVFDALYVGASREEVSFVCAPASATPTAATTFSFGSATSSYGLGFDPTNGVLYMFDDDTTERDVIVIH